MYRLISRLMAVALVFTVLCSAATVMAAAEEHAAETHGENAHAANATHAAHETGLPMTWKQDLALFSLITFVVYVFVLRVGAWGPLQAGLNERERGIRQNIADAESNRLKSEAMLKDYELKLGKVQEEVRDILAEARRDADHAKQEIVTLAQQEAEATKNRAISEIERARNQALDELFEFVSSNVAQATEQVIGRALSPEDQDRLIKQSLSQLNVRRN